MENIFVVRVYGIAGYAINPVYLAGIPCATFADAARIVKEEREFYKRCNIPVSYCDIEIRI